MHRRIVRGSIASLVAGWVAACSPEAGDTVVAERDASTEVALPADPDADIKACERFIRMGLDDPASYRRVSVTRRDQPMAVEAYLKLIKEDYPALSAMIRRKAEPGFALRDLTIESSSRDSAGGERRRTDTCRFDLYGGRLADEAEMDMRLNALASRREAIDILAVTGREPTLGTADSLSCCLPIRL